MNPRAPRTLPYRTSPALAHALPSRRRERAGSLGGRLPRYLLFIGVLVGFLVSAGLVVAPQISALAHHFTTPPQNGGTWTTLAPADLQTVLSYAQQMRSDDSLVQVREGVFAKRSNVEGVQVGRQRVYYDLVPHQSYGPLRSGRVDESQINVLSRSQSGDTLILVYTLR